MPRILIVDETTAGGRIESPLQVDAEQPTLAELIALRVRAEVRRYNLERPERFHGLVQPNDLERMLNGPTERRFRPIDADRQVEVALQAFREGRFLVLMPERQAERLDETVALSDGDEVSFLRLVPLVGG